MWIARDQESNTLKLFLHKPQCVTGMHGKYWTCFHRDIGMFEHEVLVPKRHRIFNYPGTLKEKKGYITIWSGLYPEVTFENSPKELKIK